MYLIFALFAAQTTANWAMYLDNRATTESVYLRLYNKLETIILDNSADDAGDAEEPQDPALRPSGSLLFSPEIQHF